MPRKSSDRFFLSVQDQSEISPLQENHKLANYSPAPSVSTVSSTDNIDPYNAFPEVTPLSSSQAELPDITLRGIILGLLIGSILSFTNMYFGLQSGWISMMSLQSSLVAYGMGKFFATSSVQYSPSFGLTRPKYRWYDLTIPFGIKENVFIQTCSVATAAMPLAGGFVGIIPALGLLSEEDRPGQGVTPGIQLNSQQLILWGLGIAFFGVFFAIPLRRQVILKEKLKFPSGTATAQMIQLLHKESPEKEGFESTLHSEVPGNSNNVALLPPRSNISSSIIEKETKTQWMALLATFGLSSTSTLLTTIFPKYKIWPIFNWIHPDAALWDWYFTPALSYMGQGIIMGLPTCLSMLLGSIIGWGFLSPLSFYMGWAPGKVNDSTDGPRGWILWISLAVMISESVVSLSLITLKELSSQMKKFNTTSLNSTYDDDKPVIPNKALYFGLFLSTIACISSIKVLFSDIPVGSILLSIMVGCLLSVLAVRALGETDLNPVSGIGKISQVAFGVALPGNIVGNLVAGGVAEAGAMQAGEMMQDLKTGHLLSANPRAQFYGQLIGSLISVFVSVFAYQLYTSTYTIPGPEFQVPTAQVWLDMARLVNGHPLPPFTAEFSIFFALIFGIIPILKHFYSEYSFTRYLPSGIAFAIGIYNTPDFTLTRLLGALICEAYINCWLSKYIITPFSRFIRSGRSSASPDVLPCRDWNGHNFQPEIVDSVSHSDNFHSVLFTVIASGLVLGEGTMSIVVLIGKLFSK